MIGITPPLRPHLRDPERVLTVEALESRLKELAGGAAPRENGVDNALKVVQEDWSEFKSAFSSAL